MAKSNGKNSMLSGGKMGGGPTKPAGSTGFKPPKGKKK